MRSLSQARLLGGLHRAAPIPFRASCFTSGVHPPDATAQRLIACLDRRWDFPSISSSRLVAHESNALVPWRHVRSDDLATRWRLTAIAVQRFHAHGNPGLMLDNPCQHDLIEVGPVIPTIAACHVHDWCVGDAVAVIAAIDMAAGAIERRTRGLRPKRSAAVAAMRR
jgi:hypothetical protein